MQKLESVEVEKELAKLNFNDIGPVRVRETGQSKDYEYKAMINGAIWKLFWWYGRGKHKSTRYGYGIRYNYLEVVDKKYGIYRAYITKVEFTIPESGKAEITRVDTDKEAIQYREWMKNVDVI